ncbi:Protein FAR1-RELATED SEQUENCE 5 [Bienertia sinuspersici]
MATCSCKMFETEGILCRQCLWVFKEKGFKSLPTFYIISRWQKNAMSIPIFDLGGNLIEETSKMDEVKKKVGNLWVEIFSCVSLVEQNEDEFIDVIKLSNNIWKLQLYPRGNNSVNGKYLLLDLDNDEEFEAMLAATEEVGFDHFRCQVFYLTGPYQYIAI